MFFIPKSDDDDVPMILHETHHIQSVRCAQQERYQDSSNFVFQDEGEDETDEEEEEDKFTNYPHGTSHLVLQDLYALEPKLTEDSNLEDSDEENELDVEENLVEEFEEIFIMPDLEAAELLATSSIVEEHKPNILYPVSYDVALFTKDAIVDYDADIKELQELLGISDHEFNELLEKGVENDLFLDVEIENLYRDSSAWVQIEIGGDELDDRNSSLIEDKVSSPLNGECKFSREVDRMWTMPSIEESPTGLIYHYLPYNCEFVLFKDPKPPDDLLVESNFGGGIKESNILHERMGNLLEEDWVAMLKNNIGYVQLSYFQEPPDPFSILAKDFSEDMGITYRSSFEVAIIWIIIMPLNKWRVNFHITTPEVEMFQRNDKTKDALLLCEYDWKGCGNLMEDPP